MSLGFNPTSADAIGGALAATFPGTATAALAAPHPTLAGFTGAVAALTPASPHLADATGHDSVGERAANLTAPSPTLAAFSGATAASTAPRPTLSATGTVTIAAQAAMSAPSPKVSATATTTGVANADLSITTLYSLIGYGGAVCSVSVTGSPTLQATGTTGIVASATLSCPLFELAAYATATAYASANLIAPSPRMGQTAQAWLVAPSAQLTAIGSAVIAATYEAYAVNLKHTPRPGQEPVDETTHYTNFPFTHVVRHQNSYYGANSTGLYLLEGTTDNGAPIPWAWETAITDFKSPNKKTLAAAYFSGRFGTSSTIQLKKGEKSPITHAFTTPRGTLAQNHRQVFGKDRAETRTRYFALAASGTSEFELDAIECDVHNTTRRI